MWDRIKCFFFGHTPVTFTTHYLMSSHNITSGRTGFNVDPCVRCGTVFAVNLKEMKDNVG